MSWEVGGFSDAGHLDHPILFLAFQDALNDWGDTTYVWLPYARDWAELLTLTTAENVQAAQLQGAIDVALRVRYREDITEQFRIEIDERQYEIIGPPREIGRHRFLEILARRRDPGMPARAAMAMGAQR